MNENNISVDRSSARKRDEHKSTELPPSNKSQVDLPAACSNPQREMFPFIAPDVEAMQLCRKLLSELPIIKSSVEDELGHLDGVAAELKPHREIPKRKSSIDTTFNREKPTAQSVAKQLNKEWFNLNDADTKPTTELKRSSAKIGPKSSKKQKLHKSKESTPKVLKTLIQKVEECDLMPELGINELRRKYKVTNCFKFVSTNTK